MKGALSILFFFYFFIGKAQKPELVIPSGHTDGVSSVSFSPDGKYILSGSRDRTVILWDTSGHQIKSFKHKLQVKNAVFSFDGNSIISTSSDGHINMAKLTDDTIQSKYIHNTYIGAVGFSPKSKLMVISNEENGSFELRDFEGKFIKSFKESKPIISFAFAEDGTNILTGSLNSTAALWNLATNTKKVFPKPGIKGHSAEITQVSLSKDGKFVLTSSKDKTAILWNVDGTIVRRINHNSTILASDISSDNLIVTGDENGVVKIWDSKSKTGEVSFQAHKLAINSICFAPDGKSFLTASNDKTVYQWNLNGRLIKKYCGHLKPILFANFINDFSKDILTMSIDATASIWNNSDYAYHSFKIQNSINPPLVTIPLNGKEFLAGGDNGKFRYFRSNDNHLKIESKPDSNSILSSIKFSKQVTSIEISQDGSSILTGHLNNGGAQLSNRRGALLKIFKQPEAIGPAVFSTSGKYIATAGFTENIISLFDTSISDKPINKFVVPSKILSLVFLSDSILFTGNMNGLIQKWNAFNGKLIDTYGQPNGDKINTISKSKDQKFIASGSDAGIIKIWNINDKSSIELLGHTTKILSVNFSKIKKDDRELLISGSEDGTSKIWDISTGKELITMFSIDSLDWAVVAPDGLFDASSGAMELMHYTVGLEVVELDQMKSKFYQPGLLRMKLGHEKLVSLVESDIHSFELYPRFQAQIIEDHLNVNIDSKAEGSKKLSLYVGVKLLDDNINPNGLTELKNIDLLKYSKWFAEDTNIISLVSYNKDESLKSQSYRLVYRYTSGSKSGSGEINPNEKSSFKGIADLYALIVGTSNYSGEISRLVFPDKDAASMAQGVKEIGKRLFGKVYLNLLSTASQNKDSISTRENIEKVIKVFANNAKEKDVLLIYFSGHGSTYNEGGKSQFYYLTKDLQTNDLSNQNVRNNFTISTNDLSGWLTSIAAQKQVLIFDACHSGEVISSLETSARDISPSKIVALDRLKDRSGTFILTGSAADKVSFESSQYGQGLLTYTLLQGMRGLAITNQRVDVATLFGHAKDQVPILAESINKVQIPIISYPKGGGSFDIGLVDTILNIPEVKSKPVFAKSKIQSKSFGDPKKIVAGFSNYFGQFMAQGANAELIYTEYDGYPNAYSIQGNYEVIGDELRLEFKLFKGDEPVNNEVFKVASPSAPYTDLYEKAFEKIESLIKS